jgi:Skp family chaperone for outer membrane proteins
MALAATLLLLGACSTRHEVQVAPVEVKPIHITIDVNVRVQKDLEDFFGDIDNAKQNTNN